MGVQTDGPEWVLATLFIGAAVLVVFAAVREIRALRRERRSRDGESEP